MEYTLFNDTYVMYQLLEFIDESSIIVLCKTGKKLNEICKSYIKLEDDKRFEIITTSDQWDDSKLLSIYCQNNDIIKIRKIIKMDLYWSWGLESACLKGHIDIVNLMIEKGANCWNWGLCDACKNDHIDIVKLMIEKGAIKCNWCFRSIEEHLSKKC